MKVRYVITADGWPQLTVDGKRLNRGSDEVDPRVWLGLLEQLGAETKYIVR